ncbi:TPA: hypothetical protein RQK80_004574 [Vibrio vulnificus]|nr:hypothetical protein [Vibrio vulnificus]
MIIKKIYRCMRVDDDGKPQEGGNSLGVRERDVELDPKDPSTIIKNDKGMSCATTVERLIALFPTRVPERLGGKAKYARCPRETEEGVQGVWAVWEVDLATLQSKEFKVIIEDNGHVMITCDGVPYPLEDFEKHILGTKEDWRMI